MSCYAECWLSKFYVGLTEGCTDPALMLLFRSTDKKIITSNKKNLPNQLSRWAKHIEDYTEEEDDINVVFYSAPSGLIKDRLELGGYTLKNSERAYNHYLKKEIEYFEKWSVGDHRKVYEPSLNILRGMNIKSWMSALKEIHDKGLKHDRYYNWKNDDGSLISYMLREDWYGFPGINLNVALRLAIEIVHEDDEFVYDVTELIIGGYFDLDHDFVDYAYGIFSQPEGRIIVLTEGKTDTWVLSKSLSLLYPHLSDYFTFMDFDGANVGGGAGSFANMVKSFSGAGIINKVIAIFDNDTAAHAALKTLKKAKISKNIKIITLPDIDVLNNYPTIGPSGMVSMNVNGLAGSIETYLGENALRDKQDKYLPIQWTGYESGLNKYQGEIIGKDSVQNKFKQQLAVCSKDKSLIDHFDWTGVKAILENLFKVFHDDDGEKIIFSLEDAYL